MSARWAAASGSSGQALIELAVLGSLLLLLFGWLVNNALSYDYRQQATMEAFRRGLASAAGSTTPGEPTSRHLLLIQDRHVPNPSDPFAIGTVKPVSANGGVTRNYQLQVIPKGETALPRLDIRIENSTCPDETCSYTTAGFRTERGVPQGSLERYHVIYGTQNVCDEPKCGGDKGGSCLREETTFNENTQQDETVCLEYAQMTLRILDPCEGQIISRIDCTRQAAQIVDSKACKADCEKTEDRTAAKCEEICRQFMNIPLYAEGTTFSGGRWVAPRIEDLFAGITSMGVQPGSVQTVATDNALNKRETPSGINSTTRIGLAETTEREIVTRGSAGPVTETVTATRQEDSTTTWTAPW